MPRIAIFVGGLLIGLGLAAYFLIATPDESGRVSVTALIPAFIGAPIALLGAVALYERARRHAMHGAVVLGALGLIGALMRPIRAIMSGTFELNAAAGVQLAMAAICALFVILCVRSFLNARRAPK